MTEPTIPARFVASAAAILAHATEMLHDASEPSATTTGTLTLELATVLSATEGPDTLAAATCVLVTSIIVTTIHELAAMSDDDEYLATLRDRFRAWTPLLEHPEASAVIDPEQTNRPLQVATVLTALHQAAHELTDTPSRVFNAVAEMLYDSRDTVLHRVAA